MPLLKAPSKQPKTTTLQVRLEEEVRHHLDRYAGFIGANSSSVKRSSSCSCGTTTSSAGWANTRTTSTSSKSEETFLRRPRNNHEASSNQIRRAREYSVLKTARPALCSAFVSGSIRSVVTGLARCITSIGIIPTRIVNQIAKQCRLYGRHGGRKRRKPPSDCPRSSQAVAGSCALGLWTHAKAILGANTMFPGWKVLALPSGRSVGVGRVPTARLACCLTCGLHSKATQNKLDGPSMEERWLEEVSSKDRFSSAALGESFGWHAGGRM